MSKGDLPNDPQELWGMTTLSQRKPKPARPSIPPTPQDEAWAATRLSGKQEDDTPDKKYLGEARTAAKGLILQAYFKDVETIAEKLARMGLDEDSNQYTSEMFNLRLKYEKRLHQVDSLDSDALLDQAEQDINFLKDEEV